MNHRETQGRKTDSDDGKSQQNDRMGMTMILMMAACCLPILVIAVLIPLLGVPAGVVLAVLGIGVAFLAHRKFMHHGGNS